MSTVFSNEEYADIHLMYEFYNRNGQAYEATLDSCPSHYVRLVRNWSAKNYGHRWIDRRRPVSRAPRSSDLTPLYFYLWETLKDKVYRTEVTSKRINTTN
ncbi:hypothetical protein HZH68_013037 [Vespula germanica]|uniref:Uncharacterized protein n=1 Tax=Vespula germanica TaxID=30212 RepID=A0A834MW08_VESGE|nr:hypothetical protein HZH68_013037 [Vespula germanica]